MEITFYRKLANKVADSVVKNQEYSKDEEKQIRYGLVCIFSDLYKFILIFVIFSIFQMTKECLIAFISILLLRPFLAGYHAKSELVCILISFLTMLLSIVIGKMDLIPNSTELLLIVLLPIIGVLIAPVRTKKIEEKKLKNKILTALLTIIILSVDYFFIKNQILLISVILLYILALYQMLKNHINDNDLLIKTKNIT